MARLRVVNVVTKMARGGAQATVVRTLALLDRSVFEPVILTGPDVDEEGDLFADAAASGIEVEVVRHLHRPLSPVRDPAALVELARALRRHGADVVHTHSSKAGVLGRAAALLMGVPVVVHTVHGWSFNEGLGSRGRHGAVRLERWLARVTDALIVVTTRDSDLARDLRIAPPSKLHLVRSGIALDAFAAAREERVPGSAPVVGTVTRLADQKDPLTMVDAFARVAAARPDVRFRIVGDGALRDAVRVRVDENPVLHGRVELVGATDDVPGALAGLDVFVLTSRWEGLPRSVIEAMAAGVPVVATDVGGVAEVVNDGVSGVLVRPGDAAAVARGVLRLLDDPALVVAYVDAATDRIASFSEDQMARDIARLYLELVDARRSAPRRRRTARIVAIESPNEEM